MRIDGNPVSSYELRMKLAAEAVMQHSQLSEDEALALAKHVLHAVDNIPERIR